MINILTSINPSYVPDNAVLKYLMDISVELIIMVFLFITLLLDVHLLRVNYRRQVAISLYIDEESGLYNNLGIKRFCKRRYSKKTKLTAILIKIPNYNQINDYYTNKNLFLKPFTSHLLCLLKPKETMARYNDNSFMFVVYKKTPQEVYAFIDEVEETLSLIEFPRLNKFNFSTVYSVCLEVLYDDREAIFDSMMLPFKYAKPTKSNVYFYDDHIRNTKARLDSIVLIREDAIRNNEIKAYFQPQVSLLTGKICGAEALARWLDKDGNPLYKPFEFIPIFENDGFVRHLDLKILADLCKLQAAWKSAGKKLIPISFNVSRVSLQDPEFISNLKKTIAENNGVPEYILVEITESAIFGNKSLVSQSLMDLKNFGIKLAMDDFGKEYSSLSLLLDSPFDEIKVDRQFVINNLGIERERIILENIIRLLNELEVKTVIEGVDQLSAIEKICQIDNKVSIQGFVYSQAVSPSQFMVIFDNVFTIYDKVVEDIPGTEFDESMYVKKEDFSTVADQNKSLAKENGLLRDELEEIRIQNKILSARQKDYLQNMQNIQQPQQPQQTSQNSYNTSSADVMALKAEIERLKYQREIDRLQLQIDRINDKNDKSQEISSKLVEKLTKNEQNSSEKAVDKEKKEDMKEKEKTAPVETAEIEKALETLKTQLPNVDKDSKAKLPIYAEYVSTSQKLVELEKKYKDDYMEHLDEAFGSEVDKNLDVLDEYNDFCAMNVKEKLQSASVETKNLYNLLVNELLEFDLKMATSENFISFRDDEQILFKVFVENTVIVLAANINKSEITPNNPLYKDSSVVRQYKGVPTTIEILSKESFDAALELINIVAKKKLLVYNKDNKKKIYI